MPYKKIADYKNIGKCLHPEHNPPQHQYLEPGVYEYECPSCGKKVRVEIPVITN